MVEKSLLMKYINRQEDINSTLLYINVFFKYLITLNECIKALIDSPKFHTFQHFITSVYLKIIFQLYLSSCAHFARNALFEPLYLHQMSFYQALHYLSLKCRICRYDAPCFIAKVL